MFPDSYRFNLTRWQDPNTDGERQMMTRQRKWQRVGFRTRPGATAVGGFSDLISGRVTGEAAMDGGKKEGTKRNSGFT